MTIRIGPHLTSQMLEAYLELRTEWLRRGEPHLSIYDLRSMPIGVAPFRQRFIDWLREHDRDLRRWVIGSAYIIQSPEGHMLTSLVRHGGAVQTPFLITSTLNEAAGWAAARFHERGMLEAELRVRAHYGLLAD